LTLGAVIVYQLHGARLKRYGETLLWNGTPET